MKTTLVFRKELRPLKFFLLLVLLAAAILPESNPAQAAPTTSSAWYDGLIQYSTITNCVSIIQGAPYQEFGAGAYVGFLADPDNALPAPNTVYYLHVVIAGLGNACSGMRAYIDIGLPANTTLAIDSTNKVYCLFDGVQIPANECPQTPVASSYNPGMFNFRSIDSANAYLWPVPQGRFLEIQIPVRSTTTLTNSPMQAKVWMFDGNSNPWLTVQQGVYVFSSTPTILYPSPSTTSIKNNTAHSEVYLYTYGVGGTGYFELGTTTSYGLIVDPVVIPAGGNAFLAWDDWGPPALQPDTVYHWRFTFTPSTGSPIVGADQTFRTLPNGVAVVGSGATGSCTEAALNTALATGFPISFSCGPLPTTITLTSAKSITGNITINGGSLVTLSTNGATNHFNVQPGAHLTLNQISLNDGNVSSCGGSIHVLGNGQLTLNKTSFSNNTTSNKGGAVCIEATGSADIHFSTFTENRASGGGGVYNDGLVNIDHSSFTANSATIHGGAIQFYSPGTISDTSFDRNTAGTNGGAIDTTKPLSITRGVFTNNSAGVRGGAINVYLGNLTVIQSTFITNHSNGYGGAIVNDAGTLTVQTSEFTGNTAVSVGGGIRSNGATIVTNSTFSGNHADATGGGIDNSESDGDTLALINTTLVSNTAGTSGGNIHLGSIPSVNVTLKNTLLASGTPNNCNKAVTSQGHNLESTNTCGLAAVGDKVNTAPKIGALQFNGGPTRTYSLLSGSPAIDAGTNTGCPNIDQRGYFRPVDGNKDGSSTCDIGAFEFDKSYLFLPWMRR